MIEQIERADDPRLEHYAHVGDHAWLRDRGLFVAEGRLLVLRLATLWPTTIESVLVSPSALAAVQDAIDRETPLYVADSTVLASVTGIDFHRGCLALGRRLPPAESGAFETARLLIALEGIANPDNLGGLFRVAAAFGVDGILLDPTTAEPLYRKAIRTSMGAVFSVPFARIAQWPAGIATFAKRAGFETVAMTTRRHATPLREFAQRRHSRVIVMLGSEATGLSEALLSLADHEVTIPTLGAVDSLNVVVAAGIGLALLGDGAH